jgi:hypothetical protein
VPIRRVLAAFAATAVIAGAVLFGRAVVASQGWLYAGFASEAGVPGSPQRIGYRLGILLLALGLLLLGGALLTGAGRLVALLLVVGAAFATVSSFVSCTDGCPLPPYEPTTLVDLVHASTSILAVLACVAAMLVLAVAPDPSPLRAAARLWLVPALPLLAYAGISLLAVGRGLSTGTSEKVMLLVVIGWTVTTAGLVGVYRRGG